VSAGANKSLRNVIIAFDISPGSVPRRSHLNAYRGEEPEGTRTLSYDYPIPRSGSDPTSAGMPDPRILRSMDGIPADRSLQCRTETLALTGTSEVLRRFDHDTRFLTAVVLSVLLIAAAVLGSEEFVQTTFVRLNAWSPSNATDQTRRTLFTSRLPPETASNPAASNPAASNPAASNPIAVRPLSSSPADPKTRMSQSSSEFVQLIPPFPEAKSRSPSHKPSVHHKLADAKTRLLALWHASLRTKQPRSSTAFWNFNERQW
jgi:hypothetical protein